MEHFSTDHMKMGSRFRESLRGRIDHENLIRLADISSDVIETFGGKINKEDWNKAKEDIEKHPRWQHVSPSKREAFISSVERHIGIPSEGD